MDRRAAAQTRTVSSACVVGHLGAPPPHPGLDPFVESLEHGDAGEALLLGGDQVPRRQLVIGAGEHVLGGFVVEAVLLPVAPVLLGQLPALQRVRLPPIEAGELLRSR